MRLKEYFLDRLYSTAGENHQKIFTPARCSNRLGNAGFFPSLEIQRMPSENHRWHLFQIGRYNPFNVNTRLKLQGYAIGNWHPMSALLDLGIAFMVYNERGEVVNFNNVYLIQTRRNNLVLGIRDTVVESWVRDTRISCRWYQNKQVRPIQHLAMTLANSNEIQQADPSFFQAPVVRPLVVVKGTTYFQPDQTLFTSGVTFSTVKDVGVLSERVIPLAGLTSFVSTLDSKRKYLIIGDRGCDIDDLDVYLTLPMLGKSFTAGRLLPKNRLENLRAITHKDFSISVDAIDALTASLLKVEGVSSNFTQAALVLRYRESTAVGKYFMQEKIHEAWKLPSERYRRVLNGIEAHLPYWTAASLESSLGNQIRYVNLEELSDQRLYNALGYDATVIALGASVEAIPVDATAVAVPPFYQTRSTVFIYDRNGLLRRWQLVFDQSVLLVEADDGYVEWLTGTFAESATLQGSAFIRPLDPFKLYRKDEVTDEGSWEEVSPAFSTDGQVSVANKTVLTTLALRTTRAHFIKQFPLSLTDNAPLTIEVEEFAIPFDEVTVFLNNHGLVKGIDFTLDGTRLIIQSTRYLQGNNTVIVRARTGIFPHNEDIGFIIHGRYSDNSRHHLSDDQNSVIFIGGRLFAKSELAYSEGANLPQVFAGLNGLPYQIQYPYVDVADLGLDPAKRQASQQVRQQVEALMTVLLPDSVITEPSVIADRQAVYSTFLAAIARDIVNGSITDVIIQQWLTQATLAEQLAAYLPWLATDVTADPKRFTPKFMVAYVTPLHAESTVSPIAYQFINTLASLFLVAPIVNNLVIGD